MLKATLAKADLALAILITDEHGNVLASAPLMSKQQQRAVLAGAEDIHQIQRRWWAVNLWDLMTGAKTMCPRGRWGSKAAKHVLFNINVVIRSVLLKHAVEPALKNLVLAFALASCVAIFLGAVLPNLVILDPFAARQPKHRSDPHRPVRRGPLPERRESREFADVHSKLSLLDEQYRGAKQNADELRTNIEQLLQRLEEGVLLFDDTAGCSWRANPPRECSPRPDEMADGPHGRAVSSIHDSGRDHWKRVRKAAESVREQPVTIPRPGLTPLRLAVSVQILRIGSGRRTWDAGYAARHREPAAVGTAARFLVAAGGHQPAHRRRGARDQESAERHGAALGSIKGQAGRRAARDRSDRPGNQAAGHGGEDVPEFQPAGGSELRPIDFNELVKQVLALVSVDANAKNVALKTVLQADKLWINGDPDLLKQAILNVINNGLEAMTAGGILNGGTLTTRTACEGGQCQLTVTDAGPGIAPEIQSRVFQLYFTTKETGSGIGLATTFRVVQLHNGTIDFTSEPGKGTTFRMRFPRMVDYQSATYTSATIGT
jgi:hypothetical protein